MATEQSRLLDLVADHLGRRGVRCALIGAAAMAVHGVSRSTIDVDLLVTDRRVLDAAFWSELPPIVSREIRAGDASDPLAGVVRLSSGGERDVDLVVGRGGWQDDILARAEETRHGGRTLPTASVADLILLKLYAGGSQDRWDIEQLLAGPDRSARVEAVERSVRQLPEDARALWRAIRAD